MQLALRQSRVLTEALVRNWNKRRAASRKEPCLGVRGGGGDVFGS